MSETRSKTATVRNRFLVMLVAVATSLGLVTVVGGGQAAASIGGAQVGLEQAHLAADGGLGDVQCDRRACEAAQLGYPDEILKLLEVHDLGIVA